MGDLSRHFSRSEFACPCCGEDDVDPKLVEALQQLRFRVKRPVYITTRWGHAGGVRCRKRNRQAGGHPQSLHLSGQAADIVIAEWSILKAYWEILKVPALKVGGIGIYPDRGFIHVDLGRKKQWGKLHGKSVSVADALAWKPGDKEDP